AHDAVDLRDGRLLLGLPGLEELGDARQTAGDVLGLRRLPGDLRDDLARRHRRPVGHHDVGPDRQRVAPDRPVGVDRRGALALEGLDRHPRLPLPALVLDDDLAGEPGDLVDLVVDGHALLDVPVDELAGDLGEDRRRVGVPLDQHLARRRLLPVAHLDLGAVDDRVALLLPALLVHHHRTPRAVHGVPGGPPGYRRCAGWHAGRCRWAWSRASTAR